MHDIESQMPLTTVYSSIGYEWLLVYVHTKFDWGMVK